MGEMGVTAEVLVVAAEDPAVSHTQLRVLVGISPWLEGRQWRPVAAATLGRQVHLTRETTARALRALVAAGWLCAGPRVDRVSTYRPGPRCQMVPDTGNLSGTAQRLGPVVVALLETGGDHPVNHSQLAGRLEVSRGAVVAAMGQLVAAGVILRGPRQGRVYTYRLPRPHTPNRSTGGTTGI